MRRSTTSVAQQDLTERDSALSARLVRHRIKLVLLSLTTSLLRGEFDGAVFSVQSH
ncbi:hypothetical protein J6590_018045 [Homalodisca vitripennis]|nr:hypothetical protein J6590_018045 [Homalodisca vitripennis]